MAINSYLLCEVLNNHVYKKINTSRYVCNLSYLTVYVDGIKINEHSIYLVGKEYDIGQINPMEGTFVCIGGKMEDAGINRDSKADIIVMQQEEQLSKLYIKICHVIEIYKQWENSLIKAVLQEMDGYAICQLSVPFLRNPMVMTTDDGEIIGVGVVKGDDLSTTFREKGTDYIVSERKKRIEQNSEFFLSQHQPIFHYLNDEYPTIILNIWVNEEHRGILYIDASNKPFNDGDYSRICILEKYLVEYMKILIQSEYKPLNYLRNGMTELIVTGRTRKNILQYGMRKINWQINDEYLCNVITEHELKNIGRKEALGRYYERACPGTLSILTEKEFISIINITRSGQSCEEIYEIIKAVNEKLQIVTGVSVPFFGILKCRTFVNQAKLAFRIAQESGKSSSCCCFKDYRMLFLIKYGAEQLSMYAMMPHEIRDMWEEDKNNGTEYVRTLGEYLLSGKSKVNTAKKMYIHISTVKYRLQRIAQLLPKECMEDRDFLLYFSAFYYYWKERIV